MTLASEPLAGAGAWIKAMVDGWAAYSEDEEKLTRVFLSPQHKACAQAVMSAMRAAGMSARIDAVGNVVGRYEAAPREDGGENARTLITGSHIDTVRDAGAYDGNLGVALPIACIAELDARGRRLPYAIEVVAFGDEEGVRFATTLSGSRTLAGTFDPRVLSVTDAAGTTLRDALVHFGCDPDAIAGEARRRESVAAFLEVHIEQGPVLEAEGLAVGTVTAINGAGRFAITVEGMAGHAGTVPMRLRRDALAGAAEMIAAVEGRAGGDEGLVATVGRLEVAPGAINVIPGRATFTLDIRAPEDLLSQPLVFSEINLVQWPRWFAAHGVPLGPTTYSLKFDRAYHVIDAALQGMGIALESNRLAERFLDSGELVLLDDAGAPVARFATQDPEPEPEN